MCNAQCADRFCDAMANETIANDKSAMGIEHHSEHWRSKFLFCFGRNPPPNFVSSAQLKFNKRRVAIIEIISNENWVIDNCVCV